MRYFLIVVMVFLISSCATSVVNFDRGFVAFEEGKAQKKENKYKFWEYQSEGGFSSVTILEKETQNYGYFKKDLDKGSIKLYVSSPSSRFQLFGVWPIVPVPLPYAPKYEVLGKDNRNLKFDIFFSYNDNEYRKNKPYKIEDVYVECNSNRYLPVNEGTVYSFDIEYKRIKEVVIVFKVKEEDKVVDEIKLKVIKKLSTGYGLGVTTFYP